MSATEMRQPTGLSAPTTARPSGDDPLAERRVGDERRCTEVPARVAGVNSAFGSLGHWPSYPSCEIVYASFT